MKDCVLTVARLIWLTLSCTCLHITYSHHIYSLLKIGICVKFDMLNAMEF